MIRSEPQPGIGTSQPVNVPDPRKGFSSTPPPRKSRNRRQILVAIGIAVLLVAATLSIYELVQTSTPNTTSVPPFPPAPAGWATFDTAWTAVSHAFGAFARGNWTILFAEGAASDGPWSPPATLWSETPPSLWEPCAAELSGMSTLTFWNGSSYPYSESPYVFSSGAAPLWTFIFNGSGTPTFVVSWILDHVVINAALGPASPCFSLGVFDGVSFDHINPSSEVDSSAIATAAIAEGGNATQIGVAPVPVPPDPAFALYFPGPQFVPVTIDGSDLWVVNYGECGQPGQLGSNFTLTAYEFNARTASGGAWSSIGLTCADAYFILNMTRVPLAAPPSASGLYREWNLTSSFLSSAVPPTWSAADLSTSLVHWWVVNGTRAGVSVYSSAAMCSPPASNISNCTAPATGWYAVLVGPNGDLLDSYPTVSNGTAWTLPGVHVVNGDRILLVAAAGFPTSAVLRTTFNTEPTVYAGADVGTT
jgi:hypothetical protein